MQHTGGCDAHDGGSCYCDDSEESAERTCLACGQCYGEDFCCRCDEGMCGMCGFEDCKCKKEQNV